MIDTGTTRSLFANPQMVHNIREAEDPAEFATNGGDLITENEATVPGFGTVSFGDDTMANIFAFSEWQTSIALHMIQLRKTRLSHTRQIKL